MIFADYFIISLQVLEDLVAFVGRSVSHYRAEAFEGLDHSVPSLHWTSLIALRSCHKFFEVLHADVFVLRNPELQIKLVGVFQKRQIAQWIARDVNLTLASPGFVPSGRNLRPAPISQGDRPLSAGSVSVDHLEYSLFR